MKSAPLPNPTLEQLTAQAKRIETILIESITGGVQLRAGLDSDTIKKYAEIYLADEGKVSRLPPIVVFEDADNLFIADGHHRLAAAKLAKLVEIPAIIKKGDVRAATEYALESNHDHGLPLTNADKRAMVKILLDDDQWARWSDREISRRCRVSPTFVGELRAKTPKAAAITTRKDKHGKERKAKHEKPPAPLKPGEVNETCQKARDTIKLVGEILQLQAFHDQADKAWKNPVKALIAAALFEHPPACSRSWIEMAIATPLDVHPGQLRRAGLINQEMNSLDELDYSLTAKARQQISVSLDLAYMKANDKGVALDRTYMKSKEKPETEEPETLGPDTVKPAKGPSLKQRRLAWMRESIAMTLEKGKVGSCSLTEAAALAMIVGVDLQPETCWSTKLLDRVTHSFVEAVAVQVSAALYMEGDPLARLPDLPDLCRIYKIDHDALVINAERTITE